MKTQCSIFVFLLLLWAVSDGQGLGLVWDNTTVLNSDEGPWWLLALLRIWCQTLQEVIPQCGEEGMRLKRQMRAIQLFLETPISEAQRMKQI